MKSLLLGAISATAILAWLLKFICNAPNDASFIEFINPVVAVNSLAFVLGWGAGLPTTLAIFTAAVLLILIPVATFMVVLRIARRFDNRVKT